jgi:hypothetical protein
VLEARLDDRRTLRAQHLQQRAVNRHPDKRDDLRSEAIDLLLENMPALEILRRPEDVDPRARAGHQVRHAKTPLRQPHIVGIRDPLRDQAGIEQQLPEPIGRAGKMVSGLRRPDTRVDPDEQHAQAWRDTILQPKMLPTRFMAHDSSLMSYADSWLMTKRPEARSLKPGAIL